MALCLVLIICQFYEFSYYHQLTMIRAQSEQELSEELNDKLNQLWVDAAEKRRELIRSKMPEYSRIGDSSSGLGEKQLLELREQLQQEVSNSKHKDIQIENLKHQAQQLANQKKYLIKELEESRISNNQNCPHLLNQSSIGNISRQKYQSSIKKLRNKSEKKQTRLQTDYNQQSSKQRLLELLRSTSEYRSYVFYYDSHQLSYLKRLQMMHKKNCTQPASQKEKNYWASLQVMDKMKALNKAYNFSLTNLQQETIVSRMKGFFQHNQQLKLRKLKKQYEEELKSAMRSGQNEIPYDVVQICRAREREVVRYNRKRTNTLTK